MLILLVYYLTISDRTGLISIVLGDFYFIKGACKSLPTACKCNVLLLTMYKACAVTSRLRKILVLEDEDECFYHVYTHSAKKTLSSR